MALTGTQGWRKHFSEDGRHLSKQTSCILHSLHPAPAPKAFVLAAALALTALPRYTPDKFALLQIFELLLLNEAHTDHLF